MTNFFSPSSRRTFDLDDGGLYDAPPAQVSSLGAEIRAYVRNYRPRAIPANVYASQYTRDFVRLILRQSPSSKTQAGNLLSGLSLFVAWCRDQPSVETNATVMDMLTFELIEDHIAWATATGKLTGGSPYIRQQMLGKILRSELTGTEVVGIKEISKHTLRPSRFTIHDLAELVERVEATGEPLWTATLASVLTRDCSLPKTDAPVGDLESIALPPRFSGFRERLLPFFDSSTMASHSAWLRMKLFLPESSFDAKSIWYLRRVDWLETSIPTSVLVRTGTVARELPPKDRLFGEFGDLAGRAQMLSGLPRFS